MLDATTAPVAAEHTALGRRHRHRQLPATALFWRQNSPAPGSVHGGGVIGLFLPRRTSPATYHQPGPQETTPLIGPGPKLVGHRPRGVVLHLFSSKLWHRWHRRAGDGGAAVVEKSRRLSRALPRATVAMGKTPPPPPHLVEIRAHQY